MSTENKNFIKSISIKNFGCFKNYELTFNEGTNLINYENGSLNEAQAKDLKYAFVALFYGVDKSDTKETNYYISGLTNTKTEIKAVLSINDAEYTIDRVFNRKYDDLVDAKKTKFGENNQTIGEKIFCSGKFKFNRESFANLMCGFVKNNINEVACPEVWNKIYYEFKSEGNNTFKDDTYKAIKELEEAYNNKSNDLAALKLWLLEYKDIENNEEIKDYCKELEIRQNECDRIIELCDSEVKEKFPNGMPSIKELESYKHRLNNGVYNDVAEFLKSTLGIDEVTDVEKQFSSMERAVNNAVLHQTDRDNKIYMLNAFKENNKDLGERYEEYRELTEGIEKVTNMLNEYKDKLDRMVEIKRVNSSWSDYYIKKKMNKLINAKFKSYFDKFDGNNMVCIENYGRLTVSDNTYISYRLAIMDTLMTSCKLDNNFMIIDVPKGSRVITSAGQYNQIFVIDSD